MTNLENCLVLNPKVIEDERGYFYESFNQKTLNSFLNHEVNFVQDNQTYSTKGVLRGLHFQKGKFAQAKLVRVSKGKVLDVAVVLGMFELSGVANVARILPLQSTCHWQKDEGQNDRRKAFVPRRITNGQECGKSFPRSSS